jgi:hypothetical protein
VPVHPHEPAPQFTGQVCPDCTYPYGRFRVCDNPACPGNPANPPDLARRHAEARAARLRDERRRAKGWRLYGESVAARRAR